MSKTSITYSLGHSSHDWPRFLELLEAVGTDAVIDVRSRPHSRYSHFCEAALRARLNFHGICYEHLPALGGDVSVSYDEAARHPSFLAGIDHVLDVSRRCRVTMLCAEHEPLQCHRFLLVARALAARGIHVGHVLRSGEVELHWQTELRLLRATGCSDDDLWRSDENCLVQAYLKQEQRVRGSGK